MIEAAPVEWRDSVLWRDPYEWLVDAWGKETGGEFDPNPLSDEGQIDYAQAIAEVSHDDIMDMIEEIVLDLRGSDAVQDDGDSVRDSERDDGQGVG